MKTITAILGVLAFSSMASGQNPDPSKWMCRNLADSGGFAYQGETVSVLRRAGQFRKQP